MKQWRPLFDTVDSLGVIKSERPLEPYEELLYRQACRATQSLCKLYDLAWENEYNEHTKDKGDPTEYRNGPEDVGPPEGESTK